MDISILSICKIRATEVGSEDMSMQNLLLLRGNTYPLIITSSSAPYHLPCHVPHPSSYLAGTIFSINPFNFGLLNSHTSHRSEKRSTRGNRRWAVEGGRLDEDARRVARW